MKIMIMVPRMPLDLDQIKGGAISALRNLLRGFSQLEEVDIRVVSYDDALDKKYVKQVFPNVSIHYEPEGKFPFHSMNYWIHGPGILRRHIREFQPDVIHFQAGNTFMFITRNVRIRAKIVLTIHGIVIDEAKRKKKLMDKMAWYFNAWTQVRTLPRNVIHLSKFSLRRFGDKIDNNIIIPNAIVPDFFNIPGKPGPTENKLLYMGVIDNNKNLYYQLQQLKILVDQKKYFTLDVLGDYLLQDIRDLIEGYIRENKLEPYVRFHGWVPQTGVVKFIEQADILVVSSKHESLPMVIAESMAAGKTVVASAVGGIPEMITHQVNGYLFHLSGQDELSKILANLYNNTEQLHSISLKARQTARETYGCDNVARKSVSFYRFSI